MPVWLTYTLLTACAGALVVGLYYGGRAGRARPKLQRVVGYLPVLALTGAYFVLRPGAGDDGPADMAAARAEAQPIFIDLYSNF